MYCGRLSEGSRRGKTVRVAVSETVFEELEFGAR